MRFLSPEPVLHLREATITRACAPQSEQRLLCATRESPHIATEGPAQPRVKINRQMLYKHRCKPSPSAHCVPRQGPPPEGHQGGQTPGQLVGESWAGNSARAAGAGDQPPPPPQQDSRLQTGVTPTSPLQLQSKTLLLLEEEEGSWPGWRGPTHTSSPAP